VSFLTPQHPKKRRAEISRIAVALINLSVLLLLMCTVPVPSYGRASRQDQTKEPLGSITSVGEVYLNDSPASAEATIFPGDRIRTGETGAATFAMGGTGTLKISSQSQVEFPGNYQFTARLEAGTVILTTIAGPNGLILRIGDYVVVSSIRQASATSKIARAPDGSFLVTCMDGSVGILTLEGKSGQFMQSSQSLTVSAKTGLMNFSPGAKGAGNFNSGWLLLGLAGAGAAAALAELGHGGKQAISPSAP
jgi:ferric-dicitrate binding protein FerR (iron transport regulator)